MAMTTEYAAQIAGKLIEQLREGVAPWQKPWQPGQRFMPYNPTTGKDYRGGNAIWLLATGYADQRWMTYKQAEAENAQVRKGEHGARLQFWIMQGTEPILDAQGKPVCDEDGKPVTRTVRYERPRVKTFTVFNAEQIDGLPPVSVRTVSEWERHGRAEAILIGSGAAIIHQAGDRAYYLPAQDEIILPERGQFSSSDGYYATALHELGHWTGAPARLDRDLAHPFGSDGYAREELRAEIASLIVGTEIGIGHDPSRHAAYVGSWIKALQNDPQEIFRAASDAEKIASLLRGFEHVQEQAQGQQMSTSSDVQADAMLIRMPAMVKEDHKILAASNERIYLAVPYAEKDAAKALGAKWDREAKAWFVPAGTDLTSLGAWLPLRDELHVTPTLDPRAEFAESIRSAGLEMDGLPDMNGQIQRVCVIGDTGKQRSGAYVGHLDGHPAGFIENHKTGIRMNWKSGAPTQALGAQDRARLAAEAAQKRHDRAIDREQITQAAALVAETAWNAARPAASNHPYLTAKGIEPGELRMGAPGQMIATTDKDSNPRNVRLEGRLLIPMRDIDGALWSVQTIDADGTKTFHKGGRLEGSHVILGTLKEDAPVIIAEGYATAATIHQATGLPVIAAFNAGNIAPVAQAYRDRHSTCTIIIAGDNDHLKDQARNVGRLKAEETAIQVAGFTLLPDFAPDDHGTDWNDYARTNGLEAATQTLMTGIRSCQAQALAVDLHRKEEQIESREHALLEERQEKAYEDREVAVVVEREQSLEVF
jgi:putative DNA primase/helicase